MKRPILATIQEHTAELILAIVAVGSGVLVSALEKPTNSTGLAVAAVGVQLAAAIYLLKYDILTRITDLLNERLELYSAISKISELDQHGNPLLMERATQAIERCRHTLGDLMNGRIRDSADSIFHLISDEIERAKSSISAVHVGYTVEHISRWNDGHMKNYYRKNVAAARRLKVVRVFVLYRKHIVDQHTGKVDQSVLAVLRQQRSDNIRVLVAWDEEVKEKSYLEDLVIIDDRVVEYGIDAGGFVSSEWPDREAFLSFDPQRVKEFLSRFKRLESFSAPLEEWIVANPGLIPDDTIPNAAVTTRGAEPK